MKYAIHMKLAWYDHIVESDNPAAFYYEIEKVQDLNCLYNMGMSMENTKKGKEGLKRLGKFLDRFHENEFTVEDYKLIDMDLSCGSFHITDVASGEEAVEELKKKYPNLEVIKC